MTANQIPYDQLDWLQIAIYFLALPVVALVGAAIGLLGRWRRGGMFWSINVGLLGGAVACVILTSAITTMPKEDIVCYFDEYVLRFRWTISIGAVVATFGCSLLAAISWRFLYAPRETQPMVFSLQSLLLIQVFLLTSLGSFIGLRLSVLRSVAQNEGMQHLIPIDGWCALGDREMMLDPSGEPDQIPEAFAANRLREIARRTRLQCVNLELDRTWKVDLTPLQREAGYDSICATCRNPDGPMIEQLAKLNAKHYWLDGDFSNLDLSPIAKSKNLTRIHLQGKHSRTTLEQLGQNESLRGVVLLCELPQSDPPVSRWPINLRSLRIDASAIIQNSDLKSLENHSALEVFDAIDFTLSEESLDALQSIAKFKRLNLVIGCLSPAGYNALANLRAAHVMLIVKHPRLVRPDFEQMLRMENLEVLELYDSLHGDDGLDLISNKKTLTRINIASPQVTAVAMLQLAGLPKLYHLGFPKHLATTSFVEDFHAKRTEFGLPFVNLVANRRAPAQTATNTSEPTP